MTTVKIAELIIDIDLKFSVNEILFEDYLCSGKAAFKAEYTPEDLANELAVSDLKVPEYCEIACICRDAAEKFIDFNRFLFHSAVVEVDGKAVAFAAKSGVGKSTHARLWQKNFADCRILNGDKPILHFDGNEFYAFGSPWQGKEGAGVNGKAKLCAICFLKRGEENSIRKISPDEAFSRSLLQISFPKEAEHRIKICELLNELTKNVECFELTCNMQDEAAFTARRALKL
ncbi:MAG: hypothetical protein ACI4MH_06275 [Candidatus Coproplasma sp.]